MSDLPANSLPAPGQVLVAIRNLEKRFTLDGEQIRVLEGVNLDVGAADFLAVRGASGAGKSTLLHLLGGLDTPSGGTIAFRGANLAGMTNAELADLRNRRVGFVFQAYHLLPELDALENVCLPARLARTSPAPAEARARELLARVGLGARLHHRPRQLSGGEQQRVAIARALVNHPDLILADEPTGNLDSHTGSGIIDLLCELRAERGMTLVIATHDAAIAGRAPRQVQLVDGRVAE